MFVFFFFFFFKQKTAYEMRISDWSSDVCFPICARCNRAALLLCPGNPVKSIACPTRFASFLAESRLSGGGFHVAGPWRAGRAAAPATDRSLHHPRRLLLCAKQHRAGTQASRHSELRPGDQAVARKGRNFPAGAAGGAWGLLLSPP